MYNPFKILGLNDNASIEDTKKQFRQLSLQLHPDKGGDEEVYAVLLDAYHHILDGYKIEVPTYVPKPKPNNKIYYVDVFITLNEGFSGCKRKITLKDGIANIDIPPGMLPMQCLLFDGLGEMNSDGVRGKLNVTIRFIMPEGYTFEKYMSKTVLIYSVKFKKNAKPDSISITVNKKTKKIKLPAKIYDGMFLKVKDFGYINNDMQQPLYIRIGVK